MRLLLFLHVQRCAQFRCGIQSRSHKSWRFIVREVPFSIVIIIAFNLTFILFQSHCFHFIKLINVNLLSDSTSSLVIIYCSIYFDDARIKIFDFLHDPTRFERVRSRLTDDGSIFNKSKKKRIGNRDFDYHNSMEVWLKYRPRDIFETNGHELTIFTSNVDAANFNGISLIEV